MIVNDTLNNITYDESYVLFNQLSTYSKCPRIITDNKQNLNLEYFLNHGERTLTKFAENTYNKYTQEQFHTTLAEIISYRFFPKWNKLLEALNRNYDILDDIKLITTTNVTDETNRTERNKSSTKSDINTTKYDFGYNVTDTTGKISDKTNVNTNPENNFVQDDNSSNTDHTAKYNITRTGSDGKHIHSDLILKEIELQKQNMIDIMFKDINSVFTSSIYRRNIK